MVFTLKKIRSLIVAALLIILGGVIGYRTARGARLPLVSQAVSVLPSTLLTNTTPPENKKNIDFSDFWLVWSRLEDQYHDPSKLDTQKMVDGAIAGMVSGLGDPYTLYLSKDNQKRTSDDLNGSFDGVGIQLGYRNQAIAVVSPLKDLPAAKAGILAGDYILHIKDAAKDVNSDVTGMSLPELVSLIRGPKGTEVTLTFLRDGGQPFEKTLTRDTIIVPSVEMTMIEKGNTKIAHISLSQFGGRTLQEWKIAVDTILADPKVDRVILDVRNNPGGYLNDAIAIASEFIPDGMIVKQQGKTEAIPYYSTGKGRLTKYPVVILLNKGSASASEIVSGAMRDRIKTPLIGENSFGKGTVQDAQELPSGAGLHVTIAKWIMPGGDWIHGTGIKPDIEVKIDPADIPKLREEKKDPQLDRAVEEIVKL